VEAGRSREEEHVQVRAAVTDPVHVRPRDVRQRLDRPADVHAQPAELGSEIVRQVGEVIMIAREQHQQ
jgi:hypothetical protein